MSEKEQGCVGFVAIILCIAGGVALGDRFGIGPAWGGLAGLIVSFIALSSMGEKKS